ncbi:MAG: hypothetical protein JSW31_09905 [Burkholderiales bacterium]|nr:MAG: hypothetical protein JSW31_09905 [Burkholderiales bacterium]
MQTVIRAAVFAAALVPAAWAQPAPATPQPSPAVADAPTPYRSVFDDYRRWTDATPQDWRRLNVEMQGLGGHAGHLRAGSMADRKPADDTAGKSSAPQEKSR